MPGFPRPTAFALLAAVSVFAGRPAYATTVTLDFSQLSVGAFTTTQYLDGFALTPRLLDSSVPQIVDSNGVYNLQSTSSVYYGGADTFLTRVDGGAFSMVSVQAAALGGDTGTFGIGIGPTGGSGGFLLGAYLTGTAAPSTFTLYDLTGYTALSGVSSVDLDPVSQNGNNEYRRSIFRQGGKKYRSVFGGHCPCSTRQCATCDTNGTAKHMLGAGRERNGTAPPGSTILCLRRQHIVCVQ